MLKAGPSRNFVPMSALFSVPFTFTAATLPLSISSWIHRCLTATWRSLPIPCLDAVCNALLESQCMRTPSVRHPISRSNSCTYFPSLMAIDMATNSASQLDRAMRGCVLQLVMITVSPR